MRFRTIYHVLCKDLLNRHPLQKKNKKKKNSLHKQPKKVKHTLKQDAICQISFANRYIQVYT